MTKRTRPARPHFWLRPGFWRWFVRLVVAGVLLALAGAVWVLVYPPALDPVRDDLQAWLSERLERPVRFERLTWTWDRGLKVRAQELRVGSEGLAAEEVRLGVAVQPLLQGRLELGTLELRGLRLALERRAGGELIAGGFRVDPERNRIFPMLARFQHFRITDGRLRWRDRTAPEPVRLVLDHWDLALEGGAGKRWVDLTARAAGGRVGVHGSIKGFAEGPTGWRVNVQARGTKLDPRAAEGYLGAGLPAAMPGPVSLWAEVNGGLGRPSRIRGHFRAAPGELRWPGRLRRPLSGVGADGTFRYRGETGSHRLTVEQVRVTVDRLAVTGSGRLSWGATTGPARLATRLQAAKTPVAALRTLYAVRGLPAPAADWLRRALAGGRIESARVRIDGPLARFPFPAGGGTFRIGARVADLDLAFHPDWPQVTGLSGRVALDRKQLTIRADSGRILRGQIRRVKASIHDLTADPPRLRLRGDLDLNLVDGVTFLERSPLQPEGFLGPGVLAGPAGLELGLDLPLGKGGKPDVRGRLRLDGAAFRPRPGVPALVGVTGEVAFQGGHLRSHGLQGELLGQPVGLGLERNADGPLRARVAGDFPARILRRALARYGLGHPLDRRLTGVVGARLGVVWGREERHAELHADLERAALVVPAPAFIGIGEPGRLDLRWRLSPTPRITGTLTTGHSQWQMLARRPRRSWLLGLSVGLGQDAPSCEPGMCRVAGTVDRLPLSEWAALVRSLQPERFAETDGAGPPLAVQAEITAGTVTWRDWDLGGGQVLLSGRSEDGAYLVTTDIRGDRAAGRVEWTRFADRGNDLEVLLERLHLPAPGDWPAAPDLAPLRAAGGDFALDLQVQAERIHLGDAHTLEDTRVQAQIRPAVWQLHGARTRMGKTELRLQGSWRQAEGRTALRVDLDTRDFGGWLRAVNVYPSMNRGAGTLGGTLRWPGRPTEFRPGALSGDLRLRMVEGEIEEFYFLSKALATLNVLDWPRQVGRGFKDVAQGGLVYRELKGALRIDGGVASLQDWVMESAPLRLLADGSLDLGAGSYDLLLRIQPLQTVDRIVSAVPVFGYLLTGDNRAVMALGYRVKGPWSDPEVRALVEEEKEGFMETLIRRLKEMKWEDVLPWR